MSDIQPRPQEPIARPVSSCASGATPATYLPLFIRAAAVPATWVPCQSEVEPMWVGPHTPAAAPVP